ncbi:ATP synthase subunit a [Sphaerisporangium krabiense]|uniref:ATP synthase subunit a n=1 Tax=Sphaerisporangium krabiense TaxID=763782 RepID=A0A7W8YZ53_9ACTN|nr:F0F1 ATP synthase subunit A [Sphaerisporangium krabiense]MBB5624425.1 F-type H+-transporting ATPase subunit a [Sphaerisporangium krabiense]GII61619.1 ATP synthase subunit a [Sphaerisporangium krabiense]
MSATLTPLASDEFHAPGLGLFDWPPIVDGQAWFNKPALYALIAVLVVVVFSFFAFSRPKLVPRGVQNVGELAYEFVRDQIARPNLGKNSDRWMPLLFSLFLFVWIMNLFGSVIFIQFPVMSRIGYPAILSIGIWLLVMYLGIKHQGPIGFFKNVMFPPGLPGWIYVLVAPIELVSTFFLRHITHAVRLFATMMAGHLIVALFSEVGWHFLFVKLTPLGAPLGVLGVLMTILLTAFELFIQALQAYVFALLAAMYINDALHAAH